MKLSVIVPAHNEEAVLSATLTRIQASLRVAGTAGELIVVDNASTDATARIARQHDAAVVFEAKRNIAAARNAGARHANGDALIFIDADTSVPDNLFSAISRVLEDAQCGGGAVAVEYDELQRPWMKWYLAGWRFWAAVFNFAQGAAQFCRRPVFDKIGGYDESIFVGEDIDFYLRMRRHVRKQGGTLHLLHEPAVVTSGRRFNKMSVWRVLVFTHPVFILLTWRHRRWWADWYERALR